MRRAIVVKGRVTGPTTVELREQVAVTGSEVDVLVPVADDRQATTDKTVGDYLRRLPAGTLSKEDLDQQLDRERESWGPR